jgi:serine/threonine protein phosphatase PrpC
VITGIKPLEPAHLRVGRPRSQVQGDGHHHRHGFFTQGGAYLGHVGDSRGYRIRNGQIQQMTEDHSLLNDYIKANKLTPEEIEHFPHKNVIVRALGMKELVQVDVTRLDPKPDDYYLLCSDGLTGMVHRGRRGETRRG